MDKWRLAMFELKLKNKDGALFHMRTPSMPKMEEMYSLCQLAHNTAGLEAPPAVVINRDPENISAEYAKVKDQTRLGQFPQEKILMGNYVEPSDGVRIRLLQFPDSSASIIGAIGLLRRKIPLPIMSWQHLIRGNYPSPIFSQEDAMYVMSCLKQKGIYAKIVPAKDVVRQSITPPKP
jgi:hypothetical protein